MGIYRKIFSIFEELKYIEKDMKVDMGAKGSYDAISERETIKLIRPMLLKYKVMALPVSAAVHSVANGVTTVEYIYRLIDTEDESFIDVASVGQGKSTADKGAGMASTYGFKYMWLRLFALVTGLDADNTSDYHHDKVENELITRHQALVTELNDLNKGGFLKSVDNYKRLQAAVAATKGNLQAIAAGEGALAGIKNGTVDPNTAGKA